MNGDVTVVLQASICASNGQCGSGHGDMEMLIPVGLFTGLPTDYLVFYVEYDRAGGPSGGFEEWSTRLRPPPVCNGIEAISQDLGCGCGNFTGLDPVLTVNPPVLGTSISVDLNTEFPYALYWIILSLGQPDPAYINSAGELTPPNPGPSVCTIFLDVANVDNIFLIQNDTTDEDGDAFVSTPIPFDPALIGLEFTFQARVCAPDAPIVGPFNDWYSNGVFVRFGCP